MKALLVIAVVVIALGALSVAGYLLFFRGPDLSPYEALKSPRISPLPSTKVIEVSFTGRPEKVLMGAFRLLYRTYYSLQGADRRAAGPPIARFKGFAGLPTDPAERAKALASFQDEDWQGAVALPVPESARELPKVEAKPPYALALTTWEYGEVAEILHVGSYETEMPTIARLEEYIAAQGYAISGDHEEIYLRGPGMPFVRPESYYTIIRYPVRKVR